MLIRASAHELSDWKPSHWHTVSNHVAKHEDLEPHFSHSVSTFSSEILGQDSSTLFLAAVWFNWITLSLTLRFPIQPMKLPEDSWPLNGRITSILGTPATRGHNSNNYCWLRYYSLNQVERILTSANIGCRKERRIH